MRLGVRRSATTHSVIFQDSGLLNQFLLLLTHLQAIVSVEDLGDEGEVEVAVALYDVLRLDDGRHVDGLGTLDDLTSAILSIAQLQGSEPHGVGIDLIQEIHVVLGILEIIGEVLDAAVSASLLQVVVEPTEENVLRRKGEQVLQLLLVLQENHELRGLLDVDGGEKLDLDDLPHHTEHQVLFLGLHTFGNIVCVDVYLQCTRRVQ